MKTTRKALHIWTIWSRLALSILGLVGGLTMKNEGVPGCPDESDSVWGRCSIAVWAPWVTTAAAFVCALCHTIALVVHWRHGGLFESRMTPWGREARTSFVFQLSLSAFTDFLLTIINGLVGYTPLIVLSALTAAVGISTAATEAVKTHRAERGGRIRRGMAQGFTLIDDRGSPMEPL